MKYVDDLDSREIEAICMVILDNSIQNNLMNINHNYTVTIDGVDFYSWMLAYVWDNKLQKEFNEKVELLNSLKRYKMVADCGCCEDDEIYFSSDDRAENVIRSLGLVSSGVFTDDLGIKHDGVDTFYGIHLYEEDLKSKNKIGMLVDKITKNML